MTPFHRAPAVHVTPSAGSSHWHLHCSTSQPHVLHGPWLCSLSWHPASCLLHDRCSCSLQTSLQNICIPCHWILMPEHNSCERQFCMWRRLGNPRALDAVLPCAQISKKLPPRYHYRLSASSCPARFAQAVWQPNARQAAACRHARGSQALDLAEAPQIANPRICTAEESRGLCSRIRSAQRGPAEGFLGWEFDDHPLQVWHILCFQDSCSVP